ncbi:enoyl-CoA hydratase-related protein [Brevibacterium sp. HMSC24B04]|uniref:enoyl-CoA hydratase-related protein n=1 Tax=Brevibacterium sp. HMSC24B04 TaxID=1581060 RepID=UPI0008A4201A|nr:enoyl-CoA hydratase-related protein [Brevibacterium sp. HMSC24B04]OFT92456.1 enoyl-CoA hydratase [Brevibacterium sp. HMSC24B04]
MTQYETIKVDISDKIGTITLAPGPMNPLSSQVMKDVTAALAEFDASDDVRAIIITGDGDKAFAAGADIKEMASLEFAEAYREDFFAGWNRLREVRKPIIAAVNGYALGGGCELAMMCDFIIASDRAQFGQPEINLGVLPGMGGSQRLTRAIGKAKAMDLCLTGRFIKADEALESNLVARVVPHDELMDTAREAAGVIASKSLIASAMVKEAVNAAFETTLDQGLVYERRLFHSSLATEDQKEGMGAFVEKRKPEFKDR